MEKAEKILVIRFSSLGDILLTTPVLRNLKKKYPKAEIDFLIYKSFEDAVKYNPNIDNVITYNKKENIEELILSLKKNNYNFVIDLHNNFRSRKITRLFKVPSVKYNKPSLKKFILVNFKINLFKKIISIPERYALTIPKLSLDEKGCEIYFNETVLPEIDYSETNIAFSPGSKHFTKMWCKKYFIELGQLLSEKGYKIILLGGKSDMEICKEISKKIKGSIDLSNNNNLLLLAANLKNCKVNICNDSGLMHLATAVGTPVITFFGSSVKEFGFEPYNTKNLLLENESLSCRPCSHVGKKKCPKKHFACMKELMPDKVLNEILVFLKSIKD